MNIKDLKPNSYKVIETPIKPVENKKTESSTFDKIQKGVTSIFPGEGVGKYLGEEAYNLTQGVKGVYHKLTGDEEKAKEEFKLFKEGQQELSTPKRVKEVVGDTAKIASTTVPGVGLIGGGALYGAGNAVQKDKDVKDTLEDTAIGAATGAVTKGAFNLAGKALTGMSKLFTPFKESFNREASMAADELGLDIPKPMFSNSRFVQNLYGRTEGGVFGSPIEQQVNGARIKMVESLTKMKQDLNRNLNLPVSGASKFDVGQKIQETKHLIDDEFRKTAESLFDQVPVESNKPALLTNSSKVIDEIIDELKQSKSPDVNKEIKYFKSLKDNLFGASSSFYDDLGKLGGVKSSPGGFQIGNAKIKNPQDLMTATETSYASLDATRKDIGARLSDAKGKSFDPINNIKTAHLSKLYGAMADDAINTVRTHYGDKAADNLLKAKEYWKAGMDEYNGIIGKTIFNSENPELLVDKLTKNISDVRKLKDNILGVGDAHKEIGGETWKAIQSVFMKDLVDKSIDTASGTVDPVKFIGQINKNMPDDKLLEIVGEPNMRKLWWAKSKLIINDLVKSSTDMGEFKFSKLKATVDKYGDETLKANMLPEDYKVLQNILKVGKSITNEQNSYDTYSLLNRVANLAISTPLSIVRFLVGRNLTSKALISETGQKLFTEGLEMGGLQKAGETLKSIPEMIKNKSGGMNVKGGQSGMSKAGTLATGATAAGIGAKMISEMENSDVETPVEQKEEKLVSMEDIQKIIQQESGGDTKAVGDKNMKNKAYGIGQIRKPALDDVNKLVENKYPKNPKDLTPEQSIEVMDIYMNEIILQQLTKSLENRKLKHTITKEDIINAYNNGATGTARNIQKGIDMEYASSVSKK